MVGLSQGNIHQAKALIKDSGESLIKLLNGLINMISKKDPEQWRKFIQTYSRLAHQDIDLFLLHFKLIQIWFRSVNRLNKNVDDILHKTDFRLSMEQLINLCVILM